MKKGTKLLAYDCIASYWENIKMAATWARANLTVKMDANMNPMLAYFDYKLTVAHSSLLFWTLLTKIKAKMRENNAAENHSLALDFAAKEKNKVYHVHKDDIIT